jgi:hypothetical protein
MSPRKASVIDYLTELFSPALIVGLICCLVWFLLELFYPSEGPWRFRLQWVLFFYVVGVVLSARLALQAETNSRAPLYALVLAALTYLGLSWFVEYPAAVRPWSFLVNLLLVGLIGWSAHRLVRDCTHLDNDEPSTTEGLLQVAGWDEAPEPIATPSNLANARRTSSRSSTFLERWQQQSEQARKRSGRVPGLWVIYFSLAALPLFGLGQALVPLDTPERRLWTFQLLAGYLACGFGLLLTTCFLGLRRYLRQRSLQMPARMTVMWLSSGAMLIWSLLLVAAVLPRPYSENALWSGWKVGSQKRQASRWAVQGDSPTEGKGKKGDSKANPDDPANKAEKNENTRKTGQSKKEDGANKDAKQGKDSATANDGKSIKERDGKGAKSEPKQQNRDGQADQQKDRGSDKTNHADGKPPPPTPPALTPYLAPLAELLKWLVFAVLIVVVLYLLIRQGLGILAHTSEWAKAWLAWWRGLIDWRGQGLDTDPTSSEALADAPFDAFRDPFANGSAARWTPRQLVRYSFAALEAWGRDHGHDRQPAETAEEYIGRLCQAYPALASAYQTLLRLYSQIEYSGQEPPQETPAQLRDFWQRLAGEVGEATHLPQA